MLSRLHALLSMTLDCCLFRLLYEKPSHLQDAALANGRPRCDCSLTHSGATRENEPSMACREAAP